MPGNKARLCVDVLYGVTENETETVLTLVLSSLLFRQHPSRPSGPFLHRPVRAGTHQTPHHSPSAVWRALLPGVWPHPAR